MGQTGNQSSHLAEMFDVKWEVTEEASDGDWGDSGASMVMGLIQSFKNTRVSVEVRVDIMH